MALRLPNWMRLSLEHDEVIGHHGMRRWWLLPPNRWFNVYLHQHRADDPRFLHDHPCDNISILLRGELVEYTPTPANRWPRSARLTPVDRRPVDVSGPEGREHVSFLAGGRQLDTGRALPRVRFRRAESAHRLQLLEGRPAWTLWIRFRNRRKWGFFEPGGWRPAVSKSQPPP